ncbi:multidrug efflux pump [Methylopila capsulata]|uniref:Acriflavin resistance protein n=1 Tax=Methylopila capsulata TaxID=61654 RepID=A0A9W6IS27_9HYPH|nr:efflux RND transporter permease subunit [Methylopila capsulata]MBM7850194.1 multidrug efflux pump [Methylopila capsulata]GLK55486.1 acriflavin resistance protein [Methylopila capsulata]
MKIAETCIRRPVFATVLSLVILLVGFVSYQRLAVREYPNVDEPTVSVTTAYPGAAARIIESQVTQVLEDSISGIEGIDVIESQSRQESSRITVRFNLNVNPDVAASDVRDRVARVRQNLPDEIDEPVIAKVEADAQPVMYLAFRSDRMNQLELTDYVNRYVLDRFKILPGVADIQIFGERKYAMRIYVDRNRLAAYALTVQDVETALSQQNVEIPSGRIESADREFSVLSRTGLQTPEEFGNIVVKVADGAQVRMRDVAKVELGAADERKQSRYDSGPAVAVGVIKQATANPLEVSQGVRKALPEIQQTLPEGVTVLLNYDQAVFIDKSIEAVWHTIAEAIVLVVLVIFFFLRTVRASLIPVVTIPVSLVATFAMMLVFGFTVNTLTLLALVLAIGLVVDDAIVVLENIYRHVEEGMKPVDAAIKGSREIGFAVIAMTVTLAAVYAPVAFSPGRTGRLFTEFALTLAGAVIVSGFVALTLTPMMCSRMLKHDPNPGRVFMAMERGFRATERGYKRLVGAALKARVLVVLLALGVAGGAGVLFTSLTSELSPVEDRGILQIRGQAPEGSTIAYSTRYTEQLEAILRDTPEVDGYLTIVGHPLIANVLGRAPLKDWSERDRSQQEIMAELSKKLRDIPGLALFTTNPPALGQRGGSRPVQFVLQTSGPYEELDKIAKAFVAKISENPNLTNIESDLELNAPELRVELDRAKIADLGLDVAMVGRTLETMLGSRQVTRFERDGEQYDVIVQLANADRATPETLSTIYVRTPDRGGQGTRMIQLSNLVKVADSVAPRELRRFNQLRSATIEMNLADGYAMGEALAYLERIATETLPETVQTDVNGQSREYVASNQSLGLIFGLAILFIYLVLAAQFESFVDPFIILLTVPLSMTGALGALWLTGGSLNVYSQIGLVTLIGLITKHGILIVEFANQLQEQGKDRREAVVEAAALRLRPILMTTGAMVLGAVPLALATGAGAESRAQIGWVIVGGMTFGTLLTLFVVPAVYSFLGRKAHAPEAGGAPALPAAAPAE